MDHCCLAHSDPTPFKFSPFRPFLSRFSNFKSLAESCSRQLRAWADYLQNSETRGQRHLTAKSRQHFDSKQKADDFQRELIEKLPPDHTLRKQR